MGGSSRPSASFSISCSLLSRCLACLIHAALRGWRLTSWEGDGAATSSGGCQRSSAPLPIRFSLLSGCLVAQMASWLQLWQQDIKFVVVGVRGLLIILPSFSLGVVVQIISHRVREGLASSLGDPSSPIVADRRTSVVTIIADRRMVCGERTSRLCAARGKGQQASCEQPANSEPRELRSSLLTVVSE